jgi:hypothetical protein
LPLAATALMPASVSENESAANFGERVIEGLRESRRPREQDARHQEECDQAIAQDWSFIRPRQGKKAEAAGIRRLQF